MQFELPSGAAQTRSSQLRGEAEQAWVREKVTEGSVSSDEAGRRRKVQAASSQTRLVTAKTYQKPSSQLHPQGWFPAPAGWQGEDKR